MMNVNPRLVGAIALTGIVVLGATACGSSSASEGTSSSTTAATWRIGLEAPLTGSQATLGQGMFDGAELAVAQINANGGVQGRKIELVAIDDAADPATGVAAATRAIAGGLDAVVGPYNSSVGVKTLPLYLQAGVVPVRLTSDNATDGQGFTLQPMTNQIAPVTAEALQKFYGATSVAILYDETQNYTVSTSAAVKAQLEAAGVTVTTYLPIQPGQSSYADALQQARATNPSVVYSAVYYPEGATIASEVANGAEGQPSPGCLLDYASYDTGYISTAGASTAAKCDVVGVPAPSDFKGSGDHVAQFLTQYGQRPGTWSPYTYDSVNFLVAGANQVGGWDANKLTQYLGTVSGWSGWTGTVDIQTATGNRVPATVVVTKVDQNGEFHVSADWAAAVGAPY